jgi:hypothetical protein
VAGELDPHHRNTLGKLFEHPPSRNVEWHEVESLLEAVGTTTHQHNGKLRTSVGAETEIIQAPRDKDLDPQMLVDVRRLLERAGYGSEGIRVIEVEHLGEGPPRNHGDSRRGAL